MSRARKGLRIKSFFAHNWIRLLRSAWVLMLITFLTVLILISVFSLQEQSNIASLGKLKIYSGNKDRVALWDRDKAIELGLNQVVTGINYLFVAAAAVLGFVSKLLIEPLLSPDKTKIKPPASILLSHSAIGCFFSIFYGFIGITYIWQIPDSESFSIYEEVGIGAAFQQISFLFAIALLILAATILVREKKEKV